MSNVFKYIPASAESKVTDLLNTYKISIHIVNQRKTKHGDFRRLPNGRFLITINNNLNLHQFLLTLIHEIAHYVTFIKFGHVQPHGKEWKNTFQSLMLPFLHPDIFPDTILPYLAHYLKNPKASTDSDVKLSLALRNFKSESGKSFIFEVPFGGTFIYKNKLYKKGNKRRTRYECVEIHSNRVYLFNQNAEVTLYEE